MANIQEAIRRLLYQFRTEGADKVIQSQEAIAASTEKTDKASLSLEKSFNNLERRYVSTVRAQQDYQRVQDRVNAAVAQNPALQDRANVVLASAAAQYAAATRGAQAFGTAQAELQARAAALAGSLGGVGSVLTGFGPGGLAAAAGIGAVVLALTHMVTAANQLADRAGKMVDFSDSIGLSTTALQALTKAGAGVGVEADKITSSFEKFSVEVDSVREGTGKLFDQLNRINPLLAREMALTTDLAQAWDVLNRARQQADNTEQRNALARAAFGRGGIQMGRVQDVTSAAGGLGGLIGNMNQLDILTEKQLKQWDELGDKIKANSKIARDNLTSIFAGPVLESQLAMTESFLEFSRAAKQFSLSGDWHSFIKSISDSSFINFIRHLPGIPGSIGSLTKLAATGGAPKQTGYDEASIAETAVPELRGMEMATGNEYEAAKKLSDELRLQIRLKEESKAASERTAAVTLQIAAMYPGMTIEGAKQLYAMQQQTVAAQSAGTAMELQAKQQASINIMVAQGKTLQEATAIATEQTALAQAQITARAQAQIVTLEGQLSVAQARSGAEAMIAQESARVAQLLAQQVPLEEALRIAALERQINEENVAKAIDNQIKGLDQQYELMKATSKEEEARLKAKHAYDNAIAKGATAEKASALASATLRNETELAAQAEEKLVKSVQRLNGYAEQVNQQAATYNQLLGEALDKAAAFEEHWSNIPGIMATVLRDTLEISKTELPQHKLWTDPNTGKPVQWNPEGYGGIMLTGQAMIALAADAQRRAYGEGNYTEIPFGFEGAGGSIIQPKNTVWDDFMKQSQDNVTKAMEELTRSTDSLNATMQAGLSPFYTQDPRTTALGFRAGARANSDWMMSGASNDNPVAAITGWTEQQVRQHGFASGGSFTVPGGYSATDNKMVSFAARSGETVTVGTPEAARSVNIDNRVIIQGNVDASAVDKLKRTQYQQAQRMRSALSAA